MGLSLASIFGGGELVTEIGKIVRQVLPDPAAQRDFDLKIAELAEKQAERENSLDLGQIEVNKAEASNANLFVSGWRPFVGWVGGIGFGYVVIGRPFMIWIPSLFGMTVNAPEIDGTALLTVLTGILGLGGMRTYEKTKGVATSLGGKILTPVSSVPGPVAPQDSEATEVPAQQPTPKRKGWFK